MGSPSSPPPASKVPTTTSNSDLEKSADQVEVSSQRAQWLRAAVLGANDGLLSTAALMIGVGAVKTDVHTTLIAGVAGLLGGAFSMAAGEFVSVYSQYDIELSQLQRERTKHIHTSRPKIFDSDLNPDQSGSPLAPRVTTNGDSMVEAEYLRKKKDLPSPFKAAGASALAFAIGALVPLLMFLAVSNKGYGVRLGMVVAAVSVALAGFGWAGAVLGRSPPLRAALRVLIGGWVAMGVTFGLTKLVGSFGSGI